MTNGLNLFVYLGNGDQQFGNIGSGLKYPFGILIEQLLPCRPFKRNLALIPVEYGQCHRDAEAYGIKIAVIPGMIKADTDLRKLLQHGDMQAFLLAFIASLQGH